MPGHGYDEGDLAKLAEINVMIATAESRGDADWLKAALAPEFAFRRADGRLVGAAAYVEAVRPSAERKTMIESISLHGDRAVATMIVTMPRDGEIKRYHNIRLFVRMNGDWKILGWANEEIA